MPFERKKPPLDAQIISVSGRGVLETDSHYIGFQNRAKTDFVYLAKPGSVSARTYYYEFSGFLVLSPGAVFSFLETEKQVKEFNFKQL